jgi:hypothetical protein
MRGIVRRILIFAAGLLAGLTAAAAVARLLIPSHGDEDSDELALVAISNGIELESRAKEFRGGTIGIWMGGVELDLSNATIAPGGARLHVTVFMGGLDLVIPSDWRVEVDARGAAHGIDATLTGQEELPETAPRLRIDVLAVAAGVDIRNAPRA